MQKFKSNSSYKIIRICPDPNVKLTFATYYSWEKRNFDIINIENDNNILDIILENNEIDAIVVQYDGINSIDDMVYKKQFYQVSLLPDYYKRKVYFYDNNQNYGIDLALKINKDQLTHYSDPLFSIVTPLYKTDIKYFQEAYKSLCEQSLNDWEWVLVDDSPEELDYIKEFIKTQRDPRLQYFRIDATNGNIGLAKWRGNCMSKGKWLVEFDHDDMFYSWTLSTIREAIEKYPNNKFIYSDNSTIDKDNKETPCMYGKDYEWGLGYGYSYKSLGMNLQLIRTDASGPMNNATIRYIVGVPNHFRCWERNFYFSIGGHNQTQRIADDYELLVRSFLYTRFTHVKCCCYAQRFDGNNSQYKDEPDTDNQGNLADIQRRTRLISIFYDEVIHNRLEELGLDDSKWIKGDPYKTAKVYEKIHPTETCEDVYIPEWANKKIDESTTN